MKIKIKARHRPRFFVFKKTLTEALEPFDGSIKLEVDVKEIKSDIREKKEIMNQLFSGGAA